ncbi:MAG: phosphotransferase [Solirubrobacteraceae bacterium]
MTTIPCARRPVGASDEWLSRLPEFIEACCAEWQLSIDEDRAHAGAWGIALFCSTASGREVVLKLCADHERLRAEASAMLAWTSGPAVAVLAHRAGALLLARARPGTPARLEPAELAELLDELHQPTAADRAGLGDWRSSIRDAVVRVPSLQLLGRDLLEEGERRPAVTLHGDLQPANILRHGGASAVIDPIGMTGPRELDVANAALYNDWGEEPSARIARLAKLTGTDPMLALRFGQLTAMYAALIHRY